MFLNDKEEKVIGTFMGNLEQYDTKEMTLIWQSGEIIAKFDTCFEDDNMADETDDYEEYTTFVFEMLKMSDKPPVFVTEDRYFCVNYHNFPDEIICDGKKIN